MAVGKPNFNLNSYGIKYFQKDDLTNTERQDLDSQQDKVNTVTGGGLKQPTKLETELGSINTQLNAGQNNKVVDKKPKASIKPSKPKVQTNLTPEQEARFDKNSARHAAEWAKLHPKPKTDKEREAGHTNTTDYYYNKPAKVNHYLGEDKKQDEVALSPVIGGVKTDHAPDDVPKGESARARWNKAHPKAAKKLGNKNRTGDSKGQGAHVAETRKPSRGKGAREEFLNREGVGQDDDDQTAHRSKVPLDEQGSDNQAIRGVKRDLKNVKNEPNISDEDKKDLIGDNKKVTVGDKGNAGALYEKIHGHKYTEKPEKSEEEKRHDYRQELLGNLNEQQKQREEAKKKELERAASHRGGVKTRKEERRGEKDGDEQITTEEAARRNAADKESDVETTSRTHTGDYKQHVKPVDDTNQGFRMEFDREEAMEIAHKKRTDKETKNLDFQNPKDKKRREKILGHTGDKKPDNNSSLQPQPKGDRKESNVSIQHTEGKVGFDGKKQKPTQTKEQAATNEKVRQVREVTEMEKEKERKAEEKETKELKHDEKGNWKENYTPTAEEKAKKKEERLAAAAKKEEAKAKKTKKKVPKTKLSEAQMKKLMEESAARDKNKKKANDIIMDMNIMKLDLMNKKDEGEEADFGKKQEKLHRGGSIGGHNRARATAQDFRPKQTTFAEDQEEYGKIYERDNNSLKSQAAETIYKAIALKLDLSKDL
jgi:hypothetical protein